MTGRLPVARLREILGSETVAVNIHHRAVATPRGALMLGTPVGAALFATRVRSAL